MPSNRVFLDSSSYNRTMIPQGSDITQCSKCPNPPASLVAYNPAVHGASVYTKGNAVNYVSTPVTTNWLTIGTGDFTMSCWLYPLSSAASWGNAFFRWASWAIYRISSTNGISWGNDGFGVSSTASNSCPLNTWTHFAASRVSGTLRLFINGTLAATTTDNNNYTSTSGSFVVGGYDSSAVNNWDGFIAGVHIVVGTGLYTANFTPEYIPTEVANTKLLLKFDNISIHDAAFKSAVITMGNVDRTNTLSKYGSNSINFPGTTSDYLVIPTGTNSLLDFSGDFTIEFWFYTAQTTRMALVAFSSDFSFGIDYHYNGTRNVNIWASSTGSSWNLIHADAGGAGIGTISTNLNAWNHVAVVKSGNNYKSFVNGVKDRDITVAGTIFTTGRSFRIGIWGTNSLPLNANIDDFRFTKYVKYTTDFTVPGVLPVY